MRYYTPPWSCAASQKPSQSYLLDWNRIPVFLCLLTCILQLLCSQSSIPTCRMSLSSILLSQCSSGPPQSPPTTISVGLCVFCFVVPIATAFILGLLVLLSHYLEIHSSSYFIMPNLQLLFSLFFFSSFFVDFSDLVSFQPHL